MIWDRGTWRPDFDPEFGYKKGHVKFHLNGEKLQGQWHLGGDTAAGREAPPSSIETAPWAAKPYTGTTTRRRSTSRQLAGSQLTAALHRDASPDGAPVFPALRGVFSGHLSREGSALP